MRKARIETFIRRTTEDDPNKWQCDILAATGSDHHGIGKTEAEATHNATMHWIAYEDRQKPDATAHASTSPGPVNCDVRKRFQSFAAYPRTCARCGVGPCPFFDEETGDRK